MRKALNQAFFLAWLGAGCHGGPSNHPHRPTPSTPSPAVWDKPAAVASPQLRAVQAEPLAASDGVSKRERQLARDLWSAYGPPADNAVMAPSSFLEGMILLTRGSKGPTAGEMAKALKLAQTDLAKDGRELREATSGSDSSITRGQRLYLGPTIELSDSFKKLALEQFATEATTFPGTEAADKWVDAQVKTTWPPEVKLLLVNFLHLKAKWLNQFPAHSTYPGYFHSGSQTQTVPTMCLKAGLGYAEGPEYRVVELPYEGGRLVFDCLLPQKVDGLTEVEQSLTRQSLDKSLETLAVRPIDLQLPRFKFASSWDFVPWLKQAGVKNAFDDQHADFSPMSPSSLAVSGVVQKVQIAVGEEGTEALAVTQIMATPGAPGTPGPASTDFMVDHPFLFLIRDRQSGVIFFMGRVVYP